MGKIYLGRAIITSDGGRAKGDGWGYTNANPNPPDARNHVNERQIYRPRLAVKNLASSHP